MDTDNPRHPAWLEYDSAAKWCAQRGLRGERGDILPSVLSADCFALIAEDVEAFEDRVRETAYGLSMESARKAGLGD